MNKELTVLTARIDRFFRVWYRTLSDVWIRLHAGLFGRRRVPTVYQMSAVECGAACLAMILGYYGRKISASESREICGVGRDGVTARTIADSARQFGLRVKAFSLEPPALKYLSLPAIAHWNFNHFVVVETWSKKVVEIVDPGEGRRTLTPEEFDSCFTGVVLTFEPGNQFTHHGHRKDVLWLKYLKSILYAPGARGVLAQVLLTSLFLQIMGLALPLLTKVLVDRVLALQIENVMAILGLGMLVLVLVQAALGYLRSTLLIYLRGRLDSHVMFNFFEHLLTLPFTFFQQRTSGDLLLRLGSNALIRDMLTNQTLSIMLDGSFVLIYLVILLTMAPSYCLLAIVLGTLQILILIGTRRRIRNLVQRDLAAKADEQSYLVEAMKGIAMLKACGAEDRAFDRWSNLFCKQLNVSLERSYLSALVETSMSALRTLSPLALLWVGALQVLHSKLSLGTMFAMNALAASFLSPLTSLVASGQQLQIVGALLERIADVLEAEPEQLPSIGKQVFTLSGQIEFRNVCFRYDPNSSMVLNDLSFSIAPGQKAAIVGPTGSGKSTLVLLILGLYKPTNGQILFDGMPIDELSYRGLRKQFGVVLQESHLFSGSVRQNISLSNPDMSMDELKAIAEIAGIHDEIRAMPMGYESIVAEGGTTLSGGQRQRIAIARSLAHRPSILILDEATSHLDVGTEAEVDLHLSELSCTRIVIAHRLSTIRNADQIIYIENGRIVERGVHEELMTNNGSYARLVRRQLERNDETIAAVESAGEQLALT